jgi:hypothetical protein
MWQNREKCCGATVFGTPTLNFAKYLFSKVFWINGLDKVDFFVIVISPKAKRLLSISHRVAHTRVHGGNRMSKYTITEIKELMAMGFTPEQIAHMCGDAPKGKGKKPTGAKAKPELVEFVKHDGTKVMCTPKQAEAWSKWRDRSNGKTLDEVKAEWEAKHKAFKPSNELVSALKAKPTMSRKEAVAYGFVGTKDELKALKVELKVYDK